MPGRRADADPGLIDRIRWGNVGRLAALLAAGMLVITGPRGCSTTPAPAVSLPPAVRVAPAPTASVRAAKPAAAPRPKPRRRPKRRPKPPISRKRPALTTHTVVKAGRQPRNHP